MENRPESKYVRNNMTSEWLITNDFRYNRLFSDEDIDVFTYRFPVHKCDGFTILECELRVILGEQRVFIDVYDRNTINRYAPFYYIEYGNYGKMLDKIWLCINTELEKLGIKQLKEEKSDGSKNQKNKRKCNNTHKRKSGSGRL